MEKLTAGEAMTASDWRTYFCEFHRERPANTQRSFGWLRDATGATSYDILANLLAQMEAASVLDVACGDGGFMPFFRARATGGMLTGIDICAAAIDRAQAKFARGETHFVCADATMMPFKDESFDAVVSHLSLLLIEPLDHVAREIRRVLRPGCPAVFMIENQEMRTAIYRGLALEAEGFMRSEYPNFRQITTNPDVQTSSELETVMTAAGFEMVSIEPVVVGGVIRPEIVARMFASKYIFGTLDPSVRGRLYRHLVRQAKEHQDSTGRLRIEVPLRTVVCH